MGLFFSAFMQEHLLEFCRLSKKLNRVFEDILLFYVVFLFIVLVFQIFKDIQRYSRMYKLVPICIYIYIYVYVDIAIIHSTGLHRLYVSYKSVNIKVIF